MKPLTLPVVAQEDLSNFYWIDAAGCWIWNDLLDRGGYGRFRIKSREWRAHRVFYFNLRGPIPDELVLDHLCRVRNCVNPDHLEPVSQRTNTARGKGVTAAAAAARLKGLCSNGHELSVVGMHSPMRPTCAQCSRDRSRRYRLKRRAA